MSKNKNKGPYISMLLRHKPDGLEMDRNGWVNVDDLLVKVGISKEELDSIVHNNNKKRFSYSEDGKKIRARQGHSLDVDVELRPYVPIGNLYHGTAVGNTQSIRENGINSGTRLHVHMTDDMETAVSVGSRHGDPHVFEIDAVRMHADGICFYISENGVFLTDYVDS